MKIESKLKEIEQQKKALQAQEKKLKEMAKEQKAAGQKLEQIVKQSEYETPKALVEALIEYFDITFRGRRKGSAKPVETGRRRRTKITPELRDEVKAEVNGGASMNSVAKSRGISYAVISKICKGGYDAI